MTNTTYNQMGISFERGDSYNSMALLHLPIIRPSDNTPGLTYMLYMTLRATEDKEHFSQEILKKDYPKTKELRESGQAKYRDSLIPKYVHEDLVSGKCERIVVDYSTEGFRDIDWDYVTAILGIKRRQLIWLTGIWNPWYLNKDNEVMIRFNNFWETFIEAQCRYSPDNKFNTDYNQQIKDIENLKIRQYHGLSYNRRPHPHRAWMLGKMKAEGLLNQTAWSWGGMKMYQEQSLNGMYESAHRQGYLEEHEKDGFMFIVNLDERVFPNEDLSTNKADSLNFDHIRSAYFQIVTETFVDNEKDSPFLSEKSYKPFASGMPFVVWGQAKTVHALNTQGYIPFNKWIDQSYDDIMDDAKRLKSLMKEIKRLCSIPPETWSIMLKEMLPVIEQNRYILSKSQRTQCPGIYIDTMDWDLNLKIGWEKHNT
jgi:hypothetical protein